MIRFCILLTLSIFSLAASAQEIFFDRPDTVGKTQTAQLRLKLSRDYTFMIPGAGKPIRKLETMDLVLLTDWKIERVNQSGLPVMLTLMPRVLGGTLNGRKIDPALLQGRKIRAGLGSYPCMFIASDGKPLSDDAIVILSALFRPQQGITYADILGKSQTYKPGKRWLPDLTKVLDSLSQRNVKIEKKNINAYAMFENKLKVNGMDCVSVALNLSSAGTHAYDFQVRTKMIFPVKKHDGGILRLSREGVEVVDRKMISGDFAAAGASVRIITKEQMEVTYAPPEKPASDPGGDFFQKIFSTGK